ncbi:MAG: TIGR02147 family protein [Bdellovibrionia bacterium]
MVISIYDFEDYRLYLNTWIEQQSQKGLKSKFASVMNVSTTLVSLILKGEKQISLEQATELVDFLGLSDRESDYFFLLVELSRAGTHKLKNRLKLKIKIAKKEAQKVSSRVKKDHELTDDKKAIYYSSWVYTGLRNLTALESYHDVSSIALRLAIPHSTVKQVLDFLIDNGLCVSQKGKITYGPAFTHIGSDSPYVNKHHQNWRIKGIQQMDRKGDDDLFFTSPMSLSEQAAKQSRDIILKSIQEIQKIAAPSTSEQVRCLNIDWFEF